MNLCNGSRSSHHARKIINLTRCDFFGKKSVKNLKTFKLKTHRANKPNLKAGKVEKMSSCSENTTKPPPRAVRRRPCWQNTTGKSKKKARYKIKKFANKQCANINLSFSFAFIPENGKEN